MATKVRGKTHSHCVHNQEAEHKQKTALALRLQGLTPVALHGCLIENDRKGLMYLNTKTVGGGTAWDGLGGVALLEEGYNWDQV